MLFLTRLQIKIDFVKQIPGALKINAREFAAPIEVRRI